MGPAHNMPSLITHTEVTETYFRWAGYDSGCRKNLLSETEWGTHPLKVFKFLTKIVLYTCSYFPTDIEIPSETALPVWAVLNRKYRASAGNFH